MSDYRFEIKKRDILGRICTYDTPHGRVVTPTLLPVVNPNINFIPPKELKEKFKAQMLITNSYIIRKTRTLADIALEEGIHSLLDFNGPVMTDSGTFQSYVHGGVDVKPLEIVEFQRDMGVDVGTILDIFSTPDRTEEQAMDDAKRTILRAKEAHGIKGDMALATTVQGSVYPDIREYCARELSAMDGDFFPIGGVVPLMENYRYREIVDIVVAAKKGLDTLKPVHLFGAGHPMLFALASALGCDFFDSSSYAKYAQGGRMMFPNGTGKLEEMEYSPCPCPVCSSCSVDELKEMDTEKRMRKLGEHNLYVSFAELRRVKESISSGTLWELVEERARVHPSLYDALSRMYDHGDYIEQFESAAKKRLMISDPAGFSRPEVVRYRNHLRERYWAGRCGKTFLLADGSKPYHVAYAKTIERIRKVTKAHIAVETPFGPVPMELDEMYPFSQSLYPMTDLDDIPAMTKIDFVSYRDGINPEELCRSVMEPDEAGGASGLDVARVAATLDMQFGGSVGARILGKTEKRITFRKSRKTARIRNIFLDGEHVFSMDAGSGRIILTRKGAVLLHDALPFPAYRVVVSEDAIPFVRQGKSVFSRFVLKCDHGIRPGDQVLVVDEEDRLLAFGRSLLNRKEMKDFSTGPAVNVKHGFDL